MTSKQIASGRLYSLNHDIVQSILIALLAEKWNGVKQNYASSYIIPCSIGCGTTEHNSHADSEMLNTL